MPAQPYRFEIAFSFAGTHRDRVRAIAQIVQAALEPGAVFYDEWFEDELGGDDADVLLQNCYEKHTLMVVADVSEDYSGRRWPQAEARAIRALRMTIDTARDAVSRLRLAYIRFAEGDVPGVHPTAITWDALAKSDDELANLILSRLAKLRAGLEPGASPAASVPKGSLHQLPPVKTHFTGRETDLAALRGLADSTSGDAATAVITAGLGGMGGIGKSELAKVLAREWQPRYPDAQLWLDGFGTRTDPPPPPAGDLIAQVIRAFHPQAGQLPDDLTTLQTLYRQTLDGKKALIVLDNAADAAQAGPLVPPAGCALIVTSRRNFMLGGKPPHPVGRLFDAEAIRLLREICPDLTEADAARVAEKCGGLPLALRLAGAHLALDGASPAAVNAYVTALAGGRLATLDADAPDAEEASIEETLRLSVDPLPAAERAAWLRLGVFTGDWDAAAARAVAGDAADTALLSRLARRNLLERVEATTAAGGEGGERYRLHDLAADYARERLGKEEGAAARDAAHLAHAGHYAAVAEASQQLYITGDPLAGLTIFDRERVQIEAAFAWLAARSDDGTSDSVLLALVDGVVYTGQALRFHPRQCIAWLEAMVEAARRLGHRQAEGNALGNLGNSYGQLGDAHRAIEYFEQRLKIAREIGDRRGEGKVLGNMGIAHLHLGDTRHAMENFEQQLVIAHETNDPRGAGAALANLGVAHSAVGETSRALEYFERQLGIAREIGDRHIEGAALGNLGNIQFQLRNDYGALGYYKQQLEIVREISDRRGESAALSGLGIIHRQLGEARSALEYHEKHLAIAREIGDRRGEGHALWNAALAHESLGERAEALARAEAALAIREAIKDPNAAMVRARVEIWRGS